MSIDIRNVRPTPTQQPAPNAAPSSVLVPFRTRTEVEQQRTGHCTNRQQRRMQVPRTRGVEAKMYRRGDEEEMGDQVQDMVKRETRRGNYDVVIMSDGVEQARRPGVQVPRG